MFKKYQHKETKEIVESFQFDGKNTEEIKKELSKKILNIRMNIDVHPTIIRSIYGDELALNICCSFPIKIGDFCFIKDNRINIYSEQVFKNAYELYIEEQQ